LSYTRCVAIVALLVLALSCEGRPGKGARRQDVTIPAGGENVTATLYPSLEPRAAGLLLVHGGEGTRDDWVLFATRAQQAGFQCLAPDFAWKLDASKAVDKASAFRRMDAALDYLHKSGVDPERTAIVGADLGANVALQYAAERPEVNAVALVSPGLNYGGISAEKALEQFGRGALFFVSGSGDAYSSDSARRLHEKAVGFAELREYPGGAHGTDLFTVSENATAQLLDWLSTVLSPSKKPSS
jgi:dienelactone hydrolase